MRIGVLRHLPSELSSIAVFAGPPSVAHAEALLRGVESKAARLDEPLDAICIGIPQTTPNLPREAPNPMAAAYLGLGLALRLWRDAFPVAEGRYGDPRSAASAALPAPHAAAVPRVLPGAARRAARAIRATSPTSEELAASDERGARHLPRGPRLPSAPAVRPLGGLPARIERLGSVLVAGCRDAAAARQLGFVPTHGVGAALTMTHGWADRPPRIGFLLSPPYFPLRVGPG